MKFLPALLFIGFGFFAGLLLGRYLLPTNQKVVETSVLTEPESKTASANPSNETSTAAATPDPMASTPMTLDELGAELELLRKLESGSEAESKGWDHLRARLRVSDIGALAKTLLDTYPSATSQDLLDMVFTELASQKPDEAWQLLLKIKSPQLRQQVGWSVGHTIADKGINKALALIAQLPDSQFKMEMRQTTLNRLASRDPEKAFALEVQYAGNRPDFEPNLWEWVRKDADAAIRAVSNLKGAVFVKATRNLISALVQRDPQEAWEFAQSLPPHSGDIWDDPLYSALSGWGSVDPEAAVSAALGLSDTEMRAECVAEISRTWADFDFPAALDYVTKLQDPHVKAKALAQMASASHASKPELFAALQEHGPVGDSYSSANLMESWARQDPRGAAEALAQLPPSQGLDEATTRFVRGWLAANGTNPQDVLAWARSLPGKTTSRQNALTAVLQEVGKTNAPLGAELIAGLDEESQCAAYEALAEGWSSRAPAEAAAWALTLPPQTSSSALARVVENWARHDPLEAAKAAARHDTSGDLVSAVVGQWLPGSPKQATDWVERLPHGEIRDAGLTRIASIVSRDDPSAAVLWAARISSAAQREEQLQLICSQWIEVDPSSARNWIASSPLSQQAKHSLMSR